MRVSLLLRSYITAAAGLSYFSVSAGSAGHDECERQFKRLSKVEIQKVPEVRDFGDAREYYFAWNAGTRSKLLLTARGPASGSCVINRGTGEGFLTLGGKDIGSFKVRAPL